MYFFDVHFFFRYWNIQCSHDSDGDNEEVAEVVEKTEEMFVTDEPYRKQDGCVTESASECHRIPSEMKNQVAQLSFMAMK